MLPMMGGSEYDYDKVSSDGTCSTIAEDEEVKKKGLVVPKGNISLTISTIAFSCTLSHNPSLPIGWEGGEEE